MLPNCTNQSLLIYEPTWSNSNTLVSCLHNTTYDVTNDTNYDADYEYISTISPVADILVGLYLLLVQILSTLFNGFVLGLSIWKRKTLKPSDIFVVWLAASDIGHPLTAYPMVISSSFMHKWIFGDVGCKWNGFTSFFFGVNSMMTLTSMSFGRLLYITHSDLARNNSRIIVFVLLAIALFSSLFWSVSPLVGWGRYGPEPFKTACTLVWDEPDHSFVTASFVFVLGFPVAVMFFSYGRILCMAMQVRHRRMKWAPRTKESRLWEKKELRLLKITMVMCFSYVMFWSPYAIVAMIKSYAKHIYLSPTLSLIPCLAAKTSHVADPVIYCLFNKNFSRYIPLLFPYKRKTNEVEQDQTTQSVPLRNVAQDLDMSSPMTNFVVEGHQGSVDEATFTPGPIVSTALDTDTTMT